MPLPLVGVEIILIFRGAEARIDSNTFLNLRFLRIRHGEYNSTIAERKTQRREVCGTRGPLLEAHEFVGRAGSKGPY